MNSKDSPSLTFAAALRVVQFCLDLLPGRTLAGSLGSGRTFAGSFCSSRAFAGSLGSGRTFPSRTFSCPGRTAAPALGPGPEVGHWLPKKKMFTRRL